MAQTLNGKNVLLNTTGFFRASDQLVLMDSPFNIQVSALEGSETKFRVEASVTGFDLVLEGLPTGRDITALATGTVGSRDIVIIARGHRIADLSYVAVYQIECLVAEV